MPGDLIQTPQTRWIQGAYESVQRGTPIQLQCFLQASSGGARWSVFRQFRTTAGYLVPDNRTLYISELRFFVGSIPFEFTLLDGSTDVGVNSAAAPADPVSINDPCGANVSTLRAPAINTIYQSHYTAEIPANRYIYAYTPPALPFAIIEIRGHEE